MDCCETATFKDQQPDEIKRLLHMVVVGGGPTGVEFAGELQDFFENDLRKWIPEIANNFHVTLVEALPSVSCESTTFFSIYFLISKGPSLFLQAAHRLYRKDIQRRDNLHPDKDNGEECNRQIH